MSLLARMLSAKDPTFDLALKQLEDISGRQGADTTLVGEMLQKAYEHVGRLGLDHDFMAKELYYALMNRVKADNQRFAKLLGGKDPDDLPDMTPRMVDYVKKLKINKEGWFLKAKVARKLLRQVPPPATIKRLGYKDVDELLAKEDLFEVYGALRFAESAKWMNEQFLPQYQKLKFSDFEHRPIKFIIYDPAKWGDIAKDYIAKKLHNITHLKELGVIELMPWQVKKARGITLKVTPLLLHYVYEIRLYSAFFKLISLKKNFGELLVDTLVADPPRVSVTKGQKVHWRVIQRYFGKLAHEDHPEIFEPHVHPEDLHWRKAEEILYDIDPMLEFYNDMDYVAVFDETGELITFNLLDVAFSYGNEVPFEQRYLYHFRESLWNEIFMRYMGEDNLRREILEQLDNELIAPEKLKVKT